MKSYAITLPNGQRFTIITDTTDCEVAEAIRERVRDEPNEQDLRDAVAMSCKWNQKRKLMELPAWQ